jgi:hypothetical protein
MSVTDCRDEAHCRLTDLKPEETGKLHGSLRQNRCAVTGVVCDIPRIESSETTALGASQLHEDRSVVDILDGAPLDVDTLRLEALPSCLEHVRQELL